MTQNNIIEIAQKLVKIEHELPNYQRARGELELTADPAELAKSVWILAEYELIIDDIEAKIRGINNAWKDELNYAKKELTNFTLALKEKAIALANPHITRKINKMTGETTYKDEHDLPTEFFSYIAEKSKMEVDYDKFTQEAYPQFFKQVWVLDRDAVEKEILENGHKNLPVKVTKTQANVALKIKDLKGELKYGKIGLS